MTSTVLISQGELSQECLRRILDMTNFCVIASASNIDELALAPALRNQKILLIVDAGHRPEAAILPIEQFKAEYPAARIAVLFDADRPTDIASLFRAGANASLQMGIPSSTLLKCLELVMLGETLLPPGLLSWMLRNDDGPAVASAADDESAQSPDFAPQLSPQEEHILHCLIEGHSNKVIANRLGIALATANVHVKAVIRKVGVHNRTQAAIWASKNAPIRPSRNYPAGRPAGIPGRAEVVR